MKTSLLAIILLMISFVTFAQPSGRNDGDRRAPQRTDRNSIENQYNRRNSPIGHNENIRTDNRRGSFNQSSGGREGHRYQMTSEVKMVPDRGYSYRENRGKEWDRGYRTDYHFQSSYHRPVLDIQRRYHDEPLEVRRARFPLIAPIRAEIFWTNAMYHDFRIYYPEVSYWRYPIGHRIACISAYDSRDYIGEVANIYGKVIETYYSNETDEYYLYLGDHFPYQDFSVVIPGYEARRFDRDPEYYFANANISVTGYVTDFEGKPEIQVHRANQISVY